MHFVKQGIMTTLGGSMAPKEFPLDMLLSKGSGSLRLSINYIARSNDFNLAQ